MNIIAVIPARYASTRLPQKPLQMLAGKTLIQRVYEAVVETNLFHRVIIATDHPMIYTHCLGFQAEVKMSSIKHQSGTDRMFEALADIHYDIAVNVQGDEPFITTEPLKKLLGVFIDETVKCASLMHSFDRTTDTENPNFVKVIVDNRSDAIYFSRSVIPFNREHKQDIIYYKHIGVYAYRPDVLQLFVRLPKGRYEEIECLEQLRLLENGIKIRMVQTEYRGIGIDTPEDLQNAETLIAFSRQQTADSITCTD